MEKILPRFSFRYSTADLWHALISSAPQTEAPRNWLPGFDSGDWHVFPTRRAREALLLGLRSLRLKPGARVGVPIFTCSVVAKTVAYAGFTPVFIDADTQTFGMSMDDLRVKVDRISALIVVHAFGYPADWDAVRSIASGMPVVEDCAQAMGSSYRSVPLGRLGLFSFFSFGFFKPLGASGGGCLVVRTQEIVEQARSLVDSCGRAMETEELRHVLQSCAYSTAFRQPLYTLLQRFKSQNCSTAAGPSEELIDISERLPILRSDYGPVTSRLRSWRGINNADFCSSIRNMLGPGWHMPAEPSYGEWNHFMLPVRAPSAEAAARAVALLRHEGVGAAPVYTDRAVALRPVGYQDDCPAGEELARTTLMFPCYESLSTYERNRILLLLTRATGAKELCSSFSASASQ